MAWWAGRGRWDGLAWDGMDGRLGGAGGCVGGWGGWSTPGLPLDRSEAQVEAVVQVDAMLLRGDVGVHHADEVEGRKLVLCARDPD